jgi:HeH/LEM domain
MSRLTSTEVIHRGEYLEPDFDPMSLTVPHLLSILTLHAVKYPTPYSKSKLVQAFNDEIKPRIKQLKKERLKQEGSLASSHGIVDGITGESMSDVHQSMIGNRMCYNASMQQDAAPPSQPPPRRSSRRLSRPPSQTPSPTKPELVSYIDSAEICAIGPDMLCNEAKASAFFRWPFFVQDLVQDC